MNQFLTFPTSSHRKCQVSWQRRIEERVRIIRNRIRDVSDIMDHPKCTKRDREKIFAALQVEIDEARKEFVREIERQKPFKFDD